MKNEKGSILVLTLVSVLVLSLMIMGLLTVGSVETTSTHNYQLDRIAYYTAMEGVETIRREIMDENANFTEISKSLAQTEVEEEYGITRGYFSGSLRQLARYEEGVLAEVPTITRYDTFKPPALVGVDEKIKYLPVTLRIHVTAKVSQNDQTAYAEIVSGVYYTIVTSDEDS